MRQLGEAGKVLLAGIVVEGRWGRGRGDEEDACTCNMSW
jgi:hypothetical protein